MAKYLWLDTEDECNRWNKHTKAEVHIAIESFFNNANIILKHDNNFKEKLCSCINGEIEVKPKIRTVTRQRDGVKCSKKYRGIEIDFFNSELRKRLNSNDLLLFEVYNREGIFYTSNGKKGFDFAQLDYRYNLLQLWNQCFGKRGLYKGEELWESALKRTVTRQRDGVKCSKKYRGIEIDFFNSELRKRLNSNDSLLFEVYNREGVFYTSNGKKGFDFAQLDYRYNLLQLWNQCFGKRGLYKGEELWESALKQNPFLKEAADEIDFNAFERGKDVEVKKEVMTILGELQFGNWGLIYRDLFKLLDADANSGVDLFVYITAHHNLLSYASDQIVNYDDTARVLNEFSHLIKVPVWLIGLDIEVK